jgi:hypothetical protein
VGPATRRRFGFTLIGFVRWWLPALVCAAAVITVIVNPTLQGLEGAAHILGAGLAILLLNLLVRVGFSGDRERDDEDAARTYFDEHGFWPDEAAARGAAPVEAAPVASPAVAHRAPPSAPRGARAPRPIPRRRGER